MRCCILCNPNPKNCKKKKIETFKQFSLKLYAAFTMTEQQKEYEAIGKLYVKGAGYV